MQKFKALLAALVVAGCGSPPASNVTVPQNTSTAPTSTAPTSTAPTSTVPTSTAPTPTPPSSTASTNVEAPAHHGQPELVHAGHDGMATAMVVADGSLFFTQMVMEGDVASSQLVKVAPRAAQTAVVVGTIGEVAASMTMEVPSLSPGKLLFVDDGSIKALSTTDATMSVFARPSPKARYRPGIATADATTYAFENGKDTASIWAIASSNKRKRLADVGTPSANDYGGRQTLATSRTHVGFVLAPQEAALARVPRTGGHVQRFSLPAPDEADDHSWAAAVVGVDDRLLAACNAEKIVYLYDWNAKGEARLLLKQSGTFNSQSALLADATHFYMVLCDGAGCSIARVAYREASPTVETLVALEEGVQPLLHKGYLYWLGHVSGKVWRMRLAR